MSFLSEFFKKIFQSKNKGPVATEQQIENEQLDVDVIVSNTAQSTVTLNAENKNTASDFLSNTKPEVTKTQYMHPLKINILDAGRTLVFFSKKTSNGIKQASEEIETKSNTTNSVMSTDLPKGLTADLVQQLLKKHEYEKNLQAPPTTTESTFTPFMFLLTCQQCKIKGEIEVYTETYICPKCGGKMILNEIRVDESKLKMQETEKIVSKFWENYTKDQHAKRQWDLLNAINNPSVIDLLGRISRKTQKISAEQPPLCIAQPEKIPVLCVTTLPELSRRASALSGHSFCYRCNISFFYPDMMNGGIIVCPNCLSRLQLSGMTKKYHAAGDIRKDGENIPIGISQNNTKQLCLPCEVSKIIQAELDYAIKPFRNIFSSHKFDLHSSFYKTFSVEKVYKCEQELFSIIKSYFFLYKLCLSDTDIKLFNNTIVMYENKKNQVLILPSIVLQKVGPTISCSRLDSISVTVSENITSKQIVAAYRTTWLHTRKDGGPDRRYSYNPEKKIPSSYNLIADISYSCTLKIGHRSWDCCVMGSTVELLRSFISSWNNLSTDL